LNAERLLISRLELHNQCIKIVVITHITKKRYTKNNVFIFVILLLQYLFIYCRLSAKTTTFCCKTTTFYCNCSRRAYFFFSRCFGGSRAHRWSGRAHRWSGRAHRWSGRAHRWSGCSSSCTSAAKRSCLGNARGSTAAEGRCAEGQGVGGLIALVAVDAGVKKARLAVFVHVG